MFNLAREFRRMSHGGVTRVGPWGTSHCYTWAYDINRLGNPCNLLIDVNHLVKVIVLVSIAVRQVCRFPHYRLSMRDGNKKSYEHFARFI